MEPTDAPQVQTLFYLPVDRVKARELLNPSIHLDDVAFHPACDGSCAQHQKKQLKQKKRSAIKSLAINKI